MNKRKKENRITYFFVLFLCLSAGLFLLAQSSPVQAFSSDEETVRVGYYQTRKFQEGDGEHSVRSGYGYEYIQKVASYTGWRYEYVSGDWQELYQKLLNGEIDLMAGIAYEEDRTNLLLYPDYEMLEQTFYIYKDIDDESMQSGEIDSYAGKKIGIAEDEKVEKFLNTWIEKMHADVEVVHYHTIEECAADFNEKKIEGFVSSDNVVSSVSYSGIIPVEMIGKEPYYLCLSNQRQDLLEDLNLALYVMNSQDSLYLEGLRNKYSADTSVSVFVSGQEIEWMESHPLVTVGYLDDFLPYSDKDKDEEVNGLVKDILPDLFSSLPGDYHPEIQYRSYEGQEEMLTALKNGEVDIIFPVGGEIPYAEEQEYQQSSSVLTVSADLLYKGDYDSTKLEKIAINRDNSLQSYYTRMHYPDSELLYYDDIEACIQAVKKGEAGSTVMNSLRVVKFIGEDSDFNLFPLAATEEICFGVNFGNTALLRLLNHGISILGEGYGMNHTYQYINSLVSYTVNDFMRDYWWIFLILIVIIFGGIFWILITRYRLLQAASQREAEHSRMLKEALKREQEAGYAKQIFLNNISHDLRTPLNGLLGIIEMNGKCEDPEEAARNRQRAKNSIYQLLDLVNNVIEMSKLETDVMPLKQESMDLICIMEEVRIAIAAKAEDAGVRFSWERTGMQAPWPMLYGNAAYIREVLQHILTNAIKYNRPGGKIVWQGELKEERSQNYLYECTISDTGIGMEADFLQHIFEPFSQEKSDARTVYRGAGLGMSIVKSLIDRMNGSIEVTSQPDVGTRVHITLPFAAAPEQNMAEEKSSDENNIQGMKILLVDDNELNLEIARFMLEEAGAEVTAARNGKQAVETYLYADSRAFDAILMDIMMPVMDGCEAARQIRNSGEADAEEIPILAVTACEAEEAERMGRAAGMNGILEKPLEGESLIQTLANVYRKNRKIQG